MQVVYREGPGGRVICFLKNPGPDARRAGWFFQGKKTLLLVPPYILLKKCLVYSPAYPFAGGPDCSPRCVDKGGKTSSSGSAFYKDDHQWPKDLVANMKRAASILKTFGQPKTLDTKGGRSLHLTFDYYCCYTVEEEAKIGQFLNSYSWTPHEVCFDKVECAIHGYSDAVSIVLMVNKKSHKDLFQWALKNEQDL